MDEHKTLSASKDEPQLLSQDGGIQLRDFNPKGLLRFQGRKCINLSCGREIMDHWLRFGSQEYWCEREGGLFSEGITDTVWNIPEGFGV